MLKELGRRQAKRDGEAKAKEVTDAAAAQLTPIQRRRVRSRVEVDTDRTSSDYLRFLPTPLAICSLPYQALPEDVTRYERRQGRMTLVVNSGELLAPNGEWTPHTHVH